MNTNKLSTNRREAFVVAIEGHWREYGYAPTVRELAQVVGLASSSTVWYWLMRLRYEGLVTWEEGKTRTIRLTQRGGPSARREKA
jgi:SOS-response transcriptional repressor LexA